MGVLAANSDFPLLCVEVGTAMEFNLCESIRRQLAKGIDVPGNFAYFYQKLPDWDVSEPLAELEAGGIDTSAIRARLEQVDISRQPQRLQKQEESSNPSLG